MKKSLLFATVAVLSVSVFAQDKSRAVYRDASGNAKMDQESNSAPIKQAKVPHEKAASTVAIGTSYNAYSILGDRQNQVIYNPAINTVGFVHRQNNGGGGGSGIISFDYSPDGGANWAINPFQLTPNLGGGDGNRYPNITIYNPVANTNLSNAYVVVTGPQLKTGTFSGASGWEGTFRSSASLTGANLDEQYMMLSTDVAGDYNEWGAAGLYTAANGVVFDATTNYDNAQTNLVADNYSKYFINRGVFNSSNNNFDWTVADTIIPNWYSTMNFTVGMLTNVASLPNMAWSPNGMIGYMVALGAEDNGSGNSMWRPYVMKTTDGGTIWNNVSDYDFSTDSILQCFIWGTNASNGNIQRPFFGSYDMVVDANGELRIFAEIASGFSNHPDSLNYTFAARQAGFLFEVATNGASWNVTFVDSILVDDYVWDTPNALSHYVRPQAARSQDGTKVFYTWLGVDPIIGSIERDLPDIFSVGHEVASGLWTPITDLSTGNNSNYTAAYQTMAVDAIENGSDKDWELPIVYGTAIGGSPLSNGLAAAQWNFIRGIGFNQADFTQTPLPNPCAVSVGELEVESTIFIYPNPTKGIIEIQLTNVKDFNYTIVDVVGNVIAKEKVFGSKTTINLSNRALGFYFVTIDSEKESVTKKVMLTK